VADLAAPASGGVARRRSPDRAAWLVVAALVAGTVLLRLRLLGAPLSPDEAGFLLVGGQWAPGRSLYGDYWVDRPPGILAVTALAQALGGGVALRLVGVVAAAVAVVAAALVGRRLAPGVRWSGAACAGLTAVLVSNPLLAVREVNGEILALPLLLLGTWMVCAWFEDGSAGWAAGAGATAVGALSLKQNLGDVVVLVALLAVVAVVCGRWRGVLLAALCFAAGAGVVVAAILALAHSRGTDVAGLWDAVVTFRWDAGHVIATESSPATGERAVRLAGAFVVSGAPLVLLLLVPLPWRWRRGHEREVGLTWVAAVLLAWEGFAVGLGGSYWLHYLLGVVPGLVLLLALALRAGAGRVASPGALVAVVLVAVTASTLVGQVVYAVRPPARDADERAVIAFVRSHHDPSATGVVAFGKADLLRAAGLTSPYPYLWSLPVRVRDPDLSRLGAVLRGADRPSWVVQQGASLSSWGIDADHADRILRRHYEEVFTSGDWQVLRVRPEPLGRPAGG
jgi:hypothetical protein